ncbi:hypothetical protein B9Z65_4936 [Elsinoe australis]|uniref:Putative ER transporter 6TM N-terminal domain-containing protein n=1 Tax=Elsinoe australis TaxID=40998 RepID=A0A2P8A6H7_9PEZI|nr:hypothetical protein B9Z65_4936 [Elsinoe australis]
MAFHIGVITQHFNARELKTLFRCSVAFWVASLLIFIQSTLQAFGSAVFFACIVTAILPPSGVVMVFVFGGLTMIVGVTLAWAWGVIAMKAALAARPALITNARLQALAQYVSSGNSAQIAIYNGFMLDTRVTVTFFCIIGIMIYLMARLRAKVPKLTLTAVFFWVVSDIFLTIGPLLPSFQGTIPLVLVKPAAATIAINLACSIFIFPESASHFALAHILELVDNAARGIPYVKTYLSDPTSSTHDHEIRSLKSKTIERWTALESALTFLSFDFSFGY